MRITPHSRFGPIAALAGLLLVWSAAAPAAALDVDGDGTVSAATDGQLILRHLFGFSGATLTNGAVGPGATRATPEAITAHLATPDSQALLDVDGNGHRDALTDGVLLLRYLEGRRGEALTTGALGNGATRTTSDQIARHIGGPDTPGQTNQALGPLAGASIRAYRLTDLASPVEGPTTADASLTDLTQAGTFGLTLSGLPDDEWILVTATGGQDLDADADGHRDATPTANTGTLHALATAADWRAGGIKVTALTDIVWRYTRNLIDQVSPRELSLRLDDLAAQFVRTDLTGDGAIDLRDLLRFSPTNVAHRAALNFDYQRLFTPDALGKSIVTALRTGDEPTLTQRLDQEFGHTLTRFPAPDSRYRSIRVTLGRSGEGRVAAPGNVLLTDSALADAQQVPVAYLTKDAARNLILTAIPTIQSQILGWTGCDLVSTDRTQCTIGLAGSRDVLVTFGPINVAPGVALLDLSGATNTLSPSGVDVLADATDTPLIARLPQLRANDYIVGSTGDGFLRRVVAVERVTATHYRLETVEATLAEVVGIGSGTLNLALTNGDLQGYQAPTARSAAPARTAAFSGLEGIRLIPSADPDDPVFRLEFGNPRAAEQAKSAQENAAQAGANFGVTLYEDSHGKVTATGAVELSLDLDFSATFCGLLCIEHWHFIVEERTTESLALRITGKIAGVKREQPIGSLSFGKLAFLIGPVPVWITPEVDLFIGLDGTIEAEWSPGIDFSQTLQAGIVYNRDIGFDSIGSGDFDANPHWQEVALTAKIKLPYLRTSPVLKIYDATGPSLPLEAYLRLSAQYERLWVSDPCEGQLKVSAFWGLASSFKWDMSGGTKLGELLHLDQLEQASEFTIKAFDRPLSTWYPEVPCTADFLQVDGNGILTSIAAGIQSTLTSTVRLVNKGVNEMPWHVDYIDDNPTEISPHVGNLAPGAAVDVLLSVGTAGLSPGVYNNPLTFRNDFDTSQPDSKTGTTQLPVRIDVTPVLSVAPVLTAANYAAPGRAQLSWTFNPASSPAPIEGYRIDTSSDGGATWTQALRLTGAALKTAQVSDLPQGLVHLRVAAYSRDSATPVSNVRSVVLPGVGSPRINDTGITTCSDGFANNGLTCPVSRKPGQDAEYGRDVTRNDDSDGHAGFSFTKLNASGNPLAASALSWSCVRDNVTWLVWEVKTDDGGLRDKDWTYSWYNSDATTNGGSAGTTDGSNNCFDAARCDTEKYVADVNAQGLCGARDWRLPSPRELISIINNSVRQGIDLAYFPNTSRSWSSSPVASNPDSAWYGSGPSRLGKHATLTVLLVRDGQ